MHKLNNIFHYYHKLLILPLSIQISILFIALISGCSVSPSIEKCPGDSPALQAQVKVKNVTKSIDTREIFHDAILNPFPYSAKYPLFLLGIEKPRDNTENPYSFRETEGYKAYPIFDLNNLNVNKDVRKDIKKVLDDPRSLVLTHALMVRKVDSQTNTANSEGCFIYNVYQNKKSANWCQNNHIITIGNHKEKWAHEGWRALEHLGDEINEAAVREHATHIILLATGWNTDEYESFWDFTYWMNALGKDFEESSKEEAFRPIFIGIAWESSWPSTFWARLPFGSWSTKGNDADAIGATWANYLLNDILKPIAHDTGAQLVAIGHSFGSRIILGAHYSKDVIVREEKESVNVPVTLIGLQAAFPTGRFTQTEGWEHQYASQPKNPASVVITTSSEDKATGIIWFGTGYIGGKGGLKELDKNGKIYEQGIAIPVCSTDTSGKPLTPPKKDMVTVYDATPFVNCELPGTSSGAHSDVYDREMGHFIGEIIRATKNMK